MLVAALALATFAGFELAACKGPNAPTNAQLEKGARDFCKARFDYKLLAAAANGALDPAPGSARATLEASEDVFCAALPAPDAGAQ